LSLMYFVDTDCFPLMNRRYSKETSAPSSSAS
jgi:hypothetical protein